MKQKRNSNRVVLFRLAAAFLMLAMFFSLELTKANAAKEDGAGAKAEGDKFIVGFDASFPPYGYKNEDGEYVGFDLDLAQEVCKRNGWEYQARPIDWDAKDMELNSGTIDCIWNGFTITGREDEYTWSDPYVDNSQVVVVKADSDIQELDDLADKTVVVQTDSSALAAFTSEDATEENKALAESFKELRQEPDYNTAFLNMESGSVDAVCMDLGVAAYQIQSRGDGYRMLDQQISTEQYAVGFKKGNTALRDQVQDALDAMVEDGTFDKIAEKWGLSDAVCLGKNQDAADDTLNTLIEQTEDAASKASDITGNGAKNEGDNFIVGFDASFPPYGYKDENGEYVGFDLSLAQEVAKRNGWNYQPRPIDWDAKDMELNSGTIDCIWNGFTITGREDEYTWSDPYVDNSQVVVVKADSDIQKLSDLAGKTVVVQNDSSALAAFTGEDATEENLALAASFKELRQEPDYNTAFLNMESGSVDAVCMDLGVAAYQIQSRGDGYRMLNEQVSTEQYGIGFKKGNTGLRDQVQVTLNEMVEDGTFAKIAEKWGLSDAVCLGKDARNIDASTNDANATTTDGASSDGTYSPAAAKKTKMNFLEICREISKGMLRSLMIFVFTLLFALPLGLLLTFVRRSRFGFFRWLARIYISIMRGTPLMLQLLVVFFGPYYVFGVAIPDSYRFPAVIIGFSLNYAAYFAEIFRAGIEGIPKGQSEAASILGYGKAQQFWRIIFPQMVKRTLPPVTNEVITLVKDTSLAIAISYTEMFLIARQTAAEQTSVFPIFVAGLFYYVFNFLVAFLMEGIEKSMKFDA